MMSVCPIKEKLQTGNNLMCLPNPSNRVALYSSGASLQRQGKYKEAIKYHFMVLNISKMTGENSGVTEAYGAIADCYTELGELEKAGKFYDQYIARLQND